MNEKPWFNPRHRYYSRETVSDRLRVLNYKIQDWFSMRIYRTRNRLQGKPAPPCPRQAHAAMEFQRRHKTRWQYDGTCSYCGSISEDMLFQAIEDGAEITPTDKSYKIYVRGDSAPKVRGACKFYFQHLSDEGRKRFLKLYNDQKIAMGHPGYFYVRPYFVKKSRSSSP